SWERKDMRKKLFIHTFLCSPKEKYAKERAPRSLAFGFPRRNGFFGAGRNSPVLLCRCVKPRLLKQSTRVFRKNRPCSAALQGAGHVLLFSFFDKLTAWQYTKKLSKHPAPEGLALVTPIRELFTGFVPEHLKFEFLNFQNN
ncbi:MAG: hypothetical protein SWH68_15735, partial [Thermodesulfobacteriota bacterium]|nr:hypothetical protein [Thermodesulfobacteriota bacterium]